MTVDNQLIEQIEEARARTLDDARPGVVDKIHASDHLTARERITLLFDESSFIEYGALAGATTQPDDEHYADGLVAGVGMIAGQSVVAASYDSSVFAGTQSDRNHRKIAKLLYLAVEHRWPFVCFVEGAGARPDDPLPPPPIAVSPRGRFELYDGLAEMNGWAPTVAVVTGNAVDGHAAIAMLCDLVITSSDASFGSADGRSRKVTDFAKTGDVDVVANNECDAIEEARRYLSFYLTEPSSGNAPPDAEHIADIIPQNRRRPYDMRKVIASFADADSTLELGADWGRSMLTVLARLDGRTVGILSLIHI